eukprot:m.212891 g.212891  ORF g.212891 m.212891 type:complete len:172 (-) comp21826_c0_seq1:1097-1612(-)
MDAMKQLTLVLVHTETDILLGMKKRGFGANRWNGFGGKIEAGETPAQGALRELQEEAEISADLHVAGKIFFEFAGDPKLLEVHVFQASSWQGEPTETEEMRPQWFKKTEVPYASMWADDSLWFPRVFAGQVFSAYFLFDNMDTFSQHIVVDGLQTLPELKAALDQQQQKSS